MKIWLAKGERAPTKEGAMCKGDWVMKSPLQEVALNDQSEPLIVMLKEGQLSLRCCGLLRPVHRANPVPDDLFAERSFMSQRSGGYRGLTCTAGSQVSAQVQ